MVSKDGTDIIVRYIRARNGKATENDVVHYMEKSKEVKEVDRASRVTTLKIIDKLEGTRIKIMKGERKGQRHYLIVDDNSEFVRIADQIENIGIMLREHPEQEAQDRCLNLLLIWLARTHKYIKDEGDKQTLNQKIINLLLKIRYKREGLSSEVTMLY